MQEPDILNEIKSIQGYLRDDEAKLLFELAKNAKVEGVIVEIGSWMGKSTVCLTKGSLEGINKQVIAIDPHVGSEEHQRTFKTVSTFTTFKQNIKRAGVEKIVKPLVMTSYEAVKQVKEPVSLLFIDGAHDYENVKQDYLSWSDKVVSGGIIAFHDTVSWPGPYRVVREELYPSRKFKNIRTVGSICYGVKTDKISVIEYLKNQFNLLLTDLRILVLKVHLPPALYQIAKKLYQYINKF